MKKILTFFAAALVSISAFADSKINFEHKNHDFGNIREADGAVTCEFQFVNDGDTPLIIVSASAECGCTKPTYPLQPIEPGKAASISVTFNPRGYAGEFTKTVKVKTNDPKQKKLRLKISGVVIPKTK